MGRAGKFNQLGLSNYSGWLVNEVFVVIIIFISAIIIGVVIIIIIIIIIIIMIIEKKRNCRHPHHYCSDQVVNLCKANNWIKPTVYQVQRKILRFPLLCVFSIAFKLHLSCIKLRQIALNCVSCSKTDGWLVFGISG